MKEMWVRIECWKRHLVEESEIEEIKMIMENDDQKSYDEVVDCYDKNPDQEYDNEVFLVKDDKVSHNVEIRDPKDGTLIWMN